MTSTYRETAVIMSVAGLIAGVSALPFFALPLFGLVSDIGILRTLIDIAVPGMILSAVASNNVHAFSPWLVVLFNWIFYAVVLVVLLKLVKVIRGN